MARSEGAPSFFFFFFLVIFLSPLSFSSGDDGSDGGGTGLEMGFYGRSCPSAEQIVRDFVNEHIPHAPSLAAPLLRMQFHDCFVRGCDGSVLINSTSSNKAEKAAIPNQTLRGFDFIDRVKAAVEAECPGVVSCADILALVARDAVGVIGGPWWQVPTGRRDGRVSEASEALSNIPAPNFNFSRLRDSFAAWGLNVTELVLLSGAHTIGVAHCPPVSARLYNFTGRGDEDPLLDPEYAVNLRRRKCRTPTDTATILEMDPGSFLTFDLGYYRQVLKRRGLFHSDAALTTDGAAREEVARLAESPIAAFLEGFAAAMEKMGRIGVKTGGGGEVRKHCAVVNVSG